MEIEESDGPGSYPDHFVVARFDEPFLGRPDLVESKDALSVSRGRVPLRYVEQDADVVYESDAVESSDYHRARAARALLALFDDLEECSTSCVPNAVAVHSQNRPLVAMYLFAYQGLSREEISELFDVERQTVKRYHRRTRSLARQNS